VEIAMYVTSRMTLVVGHRIKQTNLIGQDTRVVLPQLEQDHLVTTQRDVSKMISYFLHVAIYISHICAKVISAYFVYEVKVDPF
jgi:hypothetical protein